MSLAATALARPPMLGPLSLTFESGQVTGVIGPNGSGKSTLLRALAGLSAGPGAVSLSGQDIARLTDRPRRLAWLPATRDIPWPMRARDLVQLGLGPGARPDPIAVTAALAAAEAIAYAERRADSLSTGERARVLLARALVAKPQWLLLDEPIANIDPFHRLSIMALLQRLAADGTGIVVALHDLELAGRCDRLLLLDGGRLVADGVAAEVLSPANLAAVFSIRAGPAGWERLGGQGG